MPLLLIPLLVVVVAALWAVLLPISLLQRYRYGRMRRRAQALPLRVNAWMLLLLALPLFLSSAWIGEFWAPGARSHALVGVGVGLAVGVLGLLMTRFEDTPQGLYYTPRAWLVLLLTAVVAIRIGLGLWQLWARWHSAYTAEDWWASQASLFAVAGLLLGYYLAYTWGLKRRLRVTSRRFADPLN